MYVCTLPSRIDVNSTRNSVIWATMFIKNGPNFAPPRLFQAPLLLKSRNQVVQLPTAPLFQPPHHSKLENVFDFHDAHGKIIFRLWNGYKLLWKHLLPVVYTTEYRCAFNSIYFNRIKSLVPLYSVVKHLHNELLH